MPTNLTIHLNASASDLPLNTSGVDWVEFDSDNDSIIITDGNAAVQDGQPIPTANELNSASPRLEGSEIIIDEYLLADFSDNLLKKIDLMGNQDTQYVVAFDFDGATTTEPRLEAWDDTDLSTTDLVSLGEGNPNLSWIKAIATTSASAGTNWTGVPLAGSSAGNYLELNEGNGELTVATTLYANLKIIIPSTQTISGAENPILTCKYTTN